MSDDRKGALESILHEMLAPLAERIEQLVEENQELKAQLLKIEGQHKQIIHLLDIK